MQEHTANMTDPAKHKWFCREWEKFGPGIHAIWAIPSSDTRELQSIKFNAERFTTKQAQAWLEDNGFVPVKFEAAEVKT